MSSPTAKTVEKGPAAWTEEPVTETVGPRAGGAYDAVMALQRNAGNRAVTGLLAASSGRPLDPGTRQEMESRFGADFAKVRIHRDETAARTALAAGARAITTGRDIAFAEGYYSPSTTAGRRLIAHELAHVLQQRGGGDRTFSRAAAESEARQAGESVAAGQTATVAASATGAQADPMPVDEKKEQKPNDQGWTIEEPMVNFDIVHHVAWEGSFMMVGRKQPGAPGLGTWSNERIFTISDGEHSWLHLGFMTDSKEHPIPAENLGKMSVFTEVHYAPANGGPAVDVHYEDKQPQYRGAGTWLGFKLGFTAPGQSDLPILDLPLDGGGELTWKAGFGFGTGSVAYQVKKTFSLRTVAPAPAPQPPAATGGPGGPGATPQGPGTQGADASKKDTSKGTPLPPAPKAQKPPDESIKKITALTEAIKQAQDAVKKDPLVKALRDEFAKIQPFMPEKDAKKTIDDAIDSLVKTGVDQLIKGILKGLTGKDPSAVDPNRGPTLGPVGPKAFPSPQITIPLPLPGDKPPAKPKSFEYHFKDGLKTTYTPREDIKFTVEPPDDFDRSENPKLVIVAAKDRTELHAEERFATFDLESKKPAKVQMKAPEKPGKYVIRVETRGLRSVADAASEQEFEVTEAKKSK